MNPLFLAHLAGDFLFQPTWLVAWKEKRITGIMAHAAVHLALLSLFVIPQNLRAFLYLFLIAASHAAIDFLKIAYQKKHLAFSPAFLLDQLAHLLILIAATRFLRANPFWDTEAGIGSAAILFTFSFGMAWWNLLRISKSPHARVRAGTVSLVFAVFIISALLMRV